MPAFIVRLRKKPREFVGIFYCGLDELSELVDECTNPDSCEYLEMEAGGIYVVDRTPPVPWDGDPELTPSFLTDAQPTDTWGQYFGDELEGWQPLPPDTIAVAANQN